ncbi:hypothetical protein [Fodinicurvata sp. EGI_FJ10296]
MAKGQKRGNKEIKKPKAEKPAAPLAGTKVDAGARTLSAINAPKKK